jgi:putative phage-type endonuclease
MGGHPITSAFERRGVEPGSAEWLQFMTGSKIAAVLGLSPYESPFSLHVRMEGAVAAEPSNELQERGHYLEPAVRSWFKDQHPTWRVSRTGMWISHEWPRFAYSPDGLIRVGRRGVRLFEAKSALHAEQWGEPGSADIPIYYACQLQWGMGLLGLEVAHLAVITSQLRFAEYVVPFDAEDFGFLRSQVEVFLDRLDRGVRPDIDGHDATYEVVKALHPDIDGGAVQLSPDLAGDYCAAKAAEKDAAVEAKRCTALLAEAMGAAQVAMYGKRVIARRQAKKGGTAYEVAARDLPSSLDDGFKLEAAS